MILPFYIQATNGVYSDSVRGKWYCSYHEVLWGDNYPRYMSPNGWKRIATWYDNFNELEADFNKFGQNRLEVSENEKLDMQDQKEWARMGYKDFNKWE